MFRRKTSSQSEPGLQVYRAGVHDRSGRTVLILSPGLQIVKYFMDAKTFQKVKFVYSKNRENVELMSSFVDGENLPTEFGGKALLQYNHE